MCSWSIAATRITLGQHDCFYITFGCIRIEKLSGEFTLLYADMPGRDNKKGGFHGSDEMLRLPVIVAAGGVNSAGRTSRYHAYRRMIWDSLPRTQKLETASALGQMMGSKDDSWIRDHTLVREIELDWFDHEAVPWNRKATFKLGEGDAHFEYNPGAVGEGFIRDGHSQSLSEKLTKVILNPEAEVFLPSSRKFEVSSAGQLPTGFKPGELYASRNHPRALQMTVFAMSDALADLGMDWNELASSIPKDAVSVYVSSAMGQLAEFGYGDMLRSRALGRRVTSRQCPFGFAGMPGDFISAYLLRTFNSTGPALGACATFLYNLRLGIEDIRAGRSRIAVVGAAEAPINVEVMDGYLAMGALATDMNLRRLDGLTSDIQLDNRRACRPFGENCGFTMAESAQIVILMDDALALELGAPMIASAPYVSVRADGAKKSISGPGAGNYLTMAQSLTQARMILGEERMRIGGMVQAHGTGTPQNRVTESRLLSKMAKAFGIHDWPVAAIKSYVGHSLGAASGDQLTATLGIWEYGIIPSIGTISGLADDVETNRLAFAISEKDASITDYGLINSKGFGGNNATALILSPSVTKQLIERAHGESVLKSWYQKREVTAIKQGEIEQKRLSGDWTSTYRFDEGVVEEKDISVTDSSINFGEAEILLKREVPDSWALD